MIAINFVGGPWHGKRSEMEQPPPHWVVEEDRGDQYPRTTLYKALDWIGLDLDRARYEPNYQPRGLMFWPGTITYIARGVEPITQARARIISEDEIATLWPVAVAKQRVRDQFQQELDATLYEHAPLSPILRDEEWRLVDVPSGDHKLTCRATWLYLKEAL